MTQAAAFARTDRRYDADCRYLGLRQSPRPDGGSCLFEAITVFLALIGTTLSCINTGARVTYAMGRDDELAGNSGSAPRQKTSRRTGQSGRSAIISAIIGVFSVMLYFCGGAALTDDTIKVSAAQHLVQLRNLRRTIRGQHSAESARHYVDKQLRDVPALHDEQHHCDRRFPRTSLVPWIQAPVRAGLWPSRESVVHVVLSGRAVLSGGNELERALRRARDFRCLGYLRWRLLHARQ